MRRQYNLRSESLSYLSALEEMSRGVGFIDYFRTTTAELELKSLWNQAENQFAEPFQIFGRKYLV